MIILYWMAGFVLAWNIAPLLVLASLPVLKHVAGALPGTGAVAVRLYRLAGVTAEACSPVP